MYRTTNFVCPWLCSFQRSFCTGKGVFVSHSASSKRKKLFYLRKSRSFFIVKLACSSIGDVEYIPLTPAPSNVTEQEPALGNRVLPLFPLSLVVQPDATIPLHIFEMRYRLLFNRIKEGDKLFGIVLYNKNNDSVARYGCLMELIRFEPLPDGRMLTVNVGKERFRVNHIIKDKPFITASVVTVEDIDCDDTIFSLGEAVWTDLNQVLSLSNKLYGKNVCLSEELRRLAPNPESRDRHRLIMFSYRVSQVLDIPVQDQQLLLQTQSTKDRFQHQLELLEHARKFLAAQLAINDALDRRNF
ncbi:hypothetical protein Gasu2_21460 [Galdieria sulphuraria]|uniref:ATP-dependent Lon protease n=1 Tax=Galdieria sulphuraria TaxID=130081 RepID=M2VXC5_GALSU|nr:ATP-dependent Lon protease [Galdieria sulphuraria]EME27896.1 ATP-dependent Lon protease [Galdieria sulphuraria]GJD07809.1 hypothetical protein Gasu2_21460 [Galdieria sulphuraria]|eukprot:XP_005704416.1 ATP-dependent Lon protease [Galdieria sulphuraria]